MRQRERDGRWLIVGIVVLLAVGAGVFYALRPLARMQVPRVPPMRREDVTLDPAPVEEASAPVADPDFVEGDGSFTCPAAFPIKANQRSGIYHLPGDLAYGRTNPNRCYRTAEAAERDGYRHALR